MKITRMKFLFFVAAVAAMQTAASPAYATYKCVDE